jgi:hypothetical protein
VSGKRLTLIFLDLTDTASVALLPSCSGLVSELSLSRGRQRTGARQRTCPRYTPTRIKRMSSPLTNRRSGRAAQHRHRLGVSSGTFLVVCLKLLNDQEIKACGQSVIFGMWHVVLGAIFLAAALGAPSNVYPISKSSVRSDPTSSVISSPSRRSSVTRTTKLLLRELSKNRV